MIKILGTGLTGLVGSRIVELLSSKYSFENISRATGIDITDYQSVEQSIKKSEAEIVLHAAAFTDVKLAEKAKDLKEKSQCYRINVLGTENVTRACELLGKKIIFFSTDMVVGGDTYPKGGFKEDADYNPLSWYSVTKAAAEKVVKKTSSPWLVMRLAYPYRAKFEKLDFVRLFIQMLREGKTITALTDRIISPTFIDDVANALDVLIESNSTGLYNTVGSEKLNIYDAAMFISKIFNLDSSLIHKTTRREFLIDRPPEPFSSALNNDKIQELGARMHTFQEGLKILKDQI